MWSLGHENWIKYGWGKTFEKNQQKNNTLYIDYRDYTPAIEKMSAIDAAFLTIDLITKTYPAPYTLMCSGGEDSQAMLWAWKLSGVPFNVVSVRYVTDGIFYNEHDLTALFQFVEKNNINVQYYDFDIIEFLENGHHGIATKFDCGSPQISTYIKMTELVKTGTILFSGNFIMNTRRSSQGGVVNWILLSMHRYSLSLKETNSVRQLIPFFFLHHPKLAYGLQPHVVRHKNDTYVKNGFEIIPVPKQTGFEKVKEYYDQYQDRVSMTDRLKYNTMQSKRVMDLLFRYPYGINNTNTYNYYTASQN
jgi:hypothetical protein